VVEVVAPKFKSPRRPKSSERPLVEDVDVVLVEGLEMVEAGEVRSESVKPDRRSSKSDIVGG